MCSNYDKWKLANPYENEPENKNERKKVLCNADKSVFFVSSKDIVCVYLFTKNTLVCFKGEEARKYSRMCSITSSKDELMDRLQLNLF